MPGEPPSLSRRRRAVRALGFAALVTGALASTVWWSIPAEPATPSLDRQWPAEVFVLAGDGIRGWRDGDAARARFSNPFGVAVGADGTVFVADAGDAPRIRAIAPDGRVSTFAGGARGFEDGPAHLARFDTPSGLAIDSHGTLYVADTGNNAVRRITPDGQVTTVAGDGVAGYRDGPAREARFNGPVGVAVDASGRVIVADTYNDRIRAIELDGTVRTLAGSSQPGVLDGPGTIARFHTPCGVAIDRLGNVHVADTGNGLIRRIGPDGLVSTRTWFPPEQLARPIGIAIGAADELYVADERGTIVEVSAEGRARILAGSTPGFRDGAGSDARFRSPAGIAVAGPGRLVVGDAGNALVRLVGAREQIGLRLPASPLIDPHFDAQQFGWEPLLWPVAPLEGPHEVAGTQGEMRGIEGGERFHAGVDVRIGAGTLVYAVRSGVVLSPIATGDFDSLNEWMRIGSMSYIHIRVGRTAHGQAFDTARFAPIVDAGGALSGMRVKRGARFEVGDLIGSVNRFNHVHMNVGWPGEEYNPLRFRLPHFSDTVPPTIARRGVQLFNEDGLRLNERIHGRTVVSGLVQVVVDAWDQANGNRRNRRLGLYDMGYQVLEPDGRPAPGFTEVHHTLRFDRLSIDPEAARLVYAPGSGIPFYGNRRTRFLYIVTNTFQGGVAAQSSWDTSRLVPGDYTLRIWAADIRGNVAVANRDVPVTVIRTPLDAGSPGALTVPDGD